MAIGEVFGGRQEMVRVLVVGRRRAGSCRRRPNIFAAVVRAGIAVLGPGRELPKGLEVPMLLFVRESQCEPSNFPQAPRVTHHVGG